jgi:hypothetical protein
VFGLNPFPESVEIADYIKKHSQPNDSIAILGSEPQIYFYSDRRAATRYIYMYPLIETHNRTAEIRKEIIQEIESAKPQFLLFVNVRYSWPLIQEGSVIAILNWLNSYVHSFYDVAGIIEIHPDGRSIYRWDRQAANYTFTSDYWLIVYKRK